jgi:hypothetical protein
MLIKIGCADSGAPYVVTGLIRQLDDRFKIDASPTLEVAKAFLDEAKCPGARGLSEDAKVTLREMLDRTDTAAESR